MWFQSQLHVLGTQNRIWLWPNYCTLLYGVFSTIETIVLYILIECLYSPDWTTGLDYWSDLFATKNHFMPCN